MVIKALAFALAAVVSLGLLAGAMLLVEGAPTPDRVQAMTINCYPTAVARMWVKKCWVRHDDGSSEQFVVMP